MKKSQRPGILRGVSLGIIATLILVLILFAGCDREQYESEAVSPESTQGSNGVDRSHQYTMRVEGTDVAVGQDQSVSLQIHPGPDLKINLDYPWNIEFDEIEGLQLGASQLRIADMTLSDEQAVIPVSVTAQESGTHRIEGRADFSVCNDERCDILRDEPVEIVVTAE